MRPLRARLPLSLVLLAGLLPACHADPTAVARGAVLISIDTLRADHLGLYGESLPTSPRIDAFAREGVVFETVRSTAPWTLPAHASMLTGLYPSRHGARTASHSLADDVPTLAEILSARGFATAAVVNGGFLNPRFGLDRGFGEYVLVPSAEDRRKGAAPGIASWAIAWLERHAHGRFFLLVHVFDVHSDYHSERRFERIFAPREGRFDGSTEQMGLVNHGDLQISPAQAEHLSRLYDAGIRQLDHDLSPLLDYLADPARTRSTLVVVTSDHGEEFLEHGGLLHTRTHYEELLRVPLILRGAGLPAGRRVEAPVSLVDLAPTLLARLGVEAPPELALDGRDLAPLWSGEASVSDGRLFFAEAAPSLDSDTLRSVTDGRYKLIRNLETGSAELYDLAEDPGEQHDLIGRESAVAAELGAALDRFSETQRLGRPLEIPEEMQEELRALGYH
jgi:arylsulfatase A-like enzyme